MSIDARLNTGLPQHPKTKKLIRRLGDSGPWALVKLLLWAASNRPDGSLAGISDEDIELAIDWNGEPFAFIRAAAEVGFLDGAEGLRTLHDWAEHNPYAAGAKDRSQSSQWAALCRRYGKEGAAKRMPDYAAKLNGKGAEPSNPAPRSENPATGSDSSAARSDPHCGIDENACPVTVPGSVSVSIEQDQEQQRDNAGERPAAKPGRDGRRGARLPDDWEPSDAVREWARAEFPAVSLAAAVDEFRDHWRAVPGQKGVKLDWDATFRNRIRQLAERAGGRPYAAAKRPGESLVDASLRELREISQRTGLSLD